LASQRIIFEKQREEGRVGVVIYLRVRGRVLILWIADCQNLLLNGIFSENVMCIFYKIWLSGRKGGVFDSLDS